jgi:hypothetical protein
MPSSPLLSEASEASPTSPKHSYPGRNTDAPFLHRLRRYHRRRSLLLLLLVFNLLDILLGHIVLLRHPLEHLIAHITLHSNLLPATSSLGNRTARRKLLAKLLRGLLQIDIEVLEAGDLGDVFALVALDALDDDFGGCALLGLAGFGRERFGGFLLGVFFGAFLRIDAKGGEVLRQGFAGVEGVVEGRVGF